MAKRADETVRVGADTTSALASFKRLSTAGKALVAGLVAFAGAKFVGLGRQLVGVFREQEQAEAKLRRALVASGQYSAAYERKLIAIANRLQAAGAAGDEAALAMSANLLSVGQVAEDSMEAALTAVLGYAKLSGKSGERTARTWALAFADIRNEGKKSLGSLEQLLGGVAAAQVHQTKEAEGGLAAQTLAIEILTQKYGEHAAGIRGSTDVYVDLERAAGDVAEEIGRIIHMFTGPPAEAAIGWLESVKDSIRGVAVLIETWGLSMEFTWARIKGVFTDNAEEVNRLGRALIKARQEAEAGFVAGGAPTTGAVSAGPSAAPTPSAPTPASAPAADTAADAAREEALRRRREAEVQDAQDRQALLVATLQGREDAELEYIRASLEAAKLHKEGLYALEDESTRALGELLIREAEMLQEIALVERDRAELAKTEAQAEELQRLREHKAALAAEEREAAERAERDRARDRAKQKAAQATFLAGMASLQTSGNKTLAKIGRAAARAGLLIDLATKPFEAFAKTSAAYPWPLGPALGAAHAAAVAAQLGVGLSAVGGGGGGGGAGAAASTAAPSVEPPEQERRPIVLHATIEADGESIARVVQRRLDYADD